MVFPTFPSILISVNITEHTIAGNTHSKPKFASGKPAITLAADSNRCPPLIADARFILSITDTANAPITAPVYVQLYLIFLSKIDISIRTIITGYIADKIGTATFINPSTPKNDKANETITDIVTTVLYLIFPSVIVSK